MQGRGRGPAGASAGGKREGLRLGPQFGILGQRKIERRPFSNLRLGPNAPVMARHDRSAERQPNAGPLVLTAIVQATEDEEEPIAESTLR